MFLESNNGRNKLVLDVNLDSVKKTDVICVQRAFCVILDAASPFDLQRDAAHDALL